MRIGIDARAASHPQRGGFKTYTEQLVQHLPRVAPEHDYIFYLDRRDTGIEESNNVALKIIPTRVPGIGAVWREQIVVPRQMEMDAAEVLHFPCNTASLLRSRCLVVTLHDVIALTSPQIPQYISPARFWQWSFSTYSALVITRVVKEASAVITVSEYEKNQILARLGVDPQKVFVTHLGVNPIMRALPDDERQRVRRQLADQFGLRVPYILGVGFEPRKNLKAIIEAFQLVLSQAPSTKPVDQISLALVVAHSPTRTALQEYVYQLGLAQRVILLGGVEAEKLMQLYNGAELLVFPSLRESFGLPPIEAMACGTPVVASSSSSMPEILGDAALLVDPCDTRELSHAIAAVLQKSELARELRAKGLAWVQRYSWERCARETARVYAEAHSKSTRGN